MTPEYMMQLPLPMIAVEKSSGRILYANAAAQSKGLAEGQPFIEAPADAGNPPDVPEKTLRITVGDQMLKATLRETMVRDEGRAVRLIAFSSLCAEAEALTEADVCALLARADRAGAANEFVRLTGEFAGAFCAALYEARAQRFVLRSEWRSRRSVSVPALSPEFAVRPKAEAEQLKKTKGAADIAVLPYMKAHGTRGFALYFLDDALTPEKRSKLTRFVSLYSAFAPDMPDSSRLVLHHGVNAMEQGVAIWKEATRALLFSNRAYRTMFGRGSRTLAEVLGKNVHGRVMRETISDGRGRYFDVTHTACGNRSQGVISTIIIDNTAYVKAQWRLDAVARTDALTGLYNRRAGLEYLERVYAQCKQQSRPLTVCFADIDGLKQINDTWGHGAGDAMIRSVAAILKKYSESAGKVCRLGGDEFVLILPGQTAPQATLLAAQISREAAHCFVGEGDGITLSFGFKQAEFTAGETVQTLISVADMEMYRQKSSKYR